MREAKPYSSKKMLFVTVLSFASAIMIIAGVFLLCRGKRRVSMHEDGDLEPVGLKEN